MLASVGLVVVTGVGRKGPAPVAQNHRPPPRTAIGPGAASTGDGGKLTVPATGDPEGTVLSGATTPTSAPATWPGGQPGAGPGTVPGAAPSAGPSAVPTTAPTAPPASVPTPTPTPAPTPTPTPAAASVVPITSVAIVASPLCLGHVCNFSASVVGGSGQFTYAWTSAKLSGGSGPSGSGQQVSLDFGGGGNWVVTCTVTDLVSQQSKSGSSAAISS